MIRFLFSFVLTVMMARWIYAETQMVFPDVVPMIDSALDYAQIPTHDRWYGKAIAKAMDNLSASAGSLIPVAQASELTVLRSYGRPVSAGRGGCRSGACDTF